MGTSAHKNYKRQDYLYWDDYFMATAKLAAQRSKDPVTQVGACIVDKTNRIVAIGYNGFPRKCEDDDFPWCKLQDLDENGDLYDCKKMYVVHAEANAILNKNTATLEGTKLYTTLFPCNECAKLIIQSGISQVLYLSDKFSEKIAYKASRRMLNAASISYQQFIPSRQTITINFEEDIMEDQNISLNSLNI